jgi:hypothetical protein
LRWGLVPTALDNGQRSTKKLLAAVLLGKIAASSLVRLACL